MLLLAGALIVGFLPLSHESCAPGVDETACVQEDETCTPSDGCVQQDELLAWQSLMQVREPTLSPRAEPSSNTSMAGADPSLDLELARLPGHTGGDRGNLTLGKTDLETLTSIIREAIRRVAAHMPDAYPPLPVVATPITTTEDPDESYWSYQDVWPKHAEKANGDEGWMFFTSVPPKEWLILVIVCCVLFLVDMFVIQRFSTDAKSHGVALLFWFLCALGYNAHIWSARGRTDAFNWCTGYFLEWILSMDNLFVFHLIFETYKTPPGQTHRAVFLGIVGAVVIRMVFFMLVSTLLNYFSWIRIPFGLLLIWSGIQAARGEDDDEDVSNTVLVRTLKWIFGTRLKNGYDDQGRLLVRDKSGRLQVTLLAMVVVLLELSDVIFALDSVSAKIAQIGDQYLAFSSTVIAMYGLRAMFFIVKDLVEMFEYLQYGLCLILVFIGIELIFARYIHLPSGTVFIVIFSVFLISTVASVARKQARSEGKDECEQAHEDGPSKSPANSEQ